MSLFEIILIAISLSMDAFAVSITLGLSVKQLRLKEMLIPGLYFGSFQALMPAVGYFFGLYFANKIQSIDHWIAFILLAFIGGKMIKDSFTAKTEETLSFQFIQMLILAFATSIDALAIGITFALLKVPLTAIFITGTTTLLLSMCGVKIGNFFGLKFKSKAEFFGGAVLVLLGIKIVIEHTFF